MATHWGNEGTIKVGSNTVAEIEKFSIESTANPIDDNAMGDTAETHISGSGLTSWTASIACHWDETDTNGQEALTIGASVTLNMYPEGATTGDKYYTGTASIVKITVTAEKTGSTIKREFEAKGNGALTYTTV